MNQRTLVVFAMAALAACTDSVDPGGGSDSGHGNGTAPDMPSAPGVYATIIGGYFAGTYALTETVACNVDVETHAYRVFGRNHGDDKDISLFTRTEPSAGATLASPGFWVNLFAVGSTLDTGAYPRANTGSCTIAIEAGWPSVRARFSCTGLVGADHSSFEIRDGYAICP